MPKKPSHPAKGIHLHGATYRLNIQRHGVRQFINLETSDFSEAVKRAELVRNTPDLLPSSGMENEIERFIAYKVRQGEYTESSAVTKKNKLKLLINAMPAGASGATITTAQLQRWHDAMVKSELASSTIHSYFMTAQAFFNWTIEIARIRRMNPVAGVKRIKLEKRARKDFCHFALRDRLIQNCEDDELKFILYCGFHAGLRYNEIVEAVPFWFDVPHKRIMLRKTATMKFKDNEERTIPMTLEFQAFLKTYGTPHPYMVAPNVTKGDSLYRYQFRKKFENYMKAQGYEWVTPHIMRHTFASLLVSAGESIYKVAVWMGDDVKTVQDHYGHLAPDEGGIEKAFSARHVPGQAATS